jgi:hypothetical protein
VWSRYIGLQIEYIIDVGANDTKTIEKALTDLEEAIDPVETEAIPPGNINSAAKSIASLAEARSEVEGAQVSETETQVSLKE